MGSSTLQVSIVVVHRGQVQVLRLLFLHSLAIRFHPPLASGQGLPLLRALEALGQTRADHLGQFQLQPLEVLPAGER